MQRTHWQVSSTAIRLQNGRVLIGTQQQILRSEHVKAGRVDAVLVTHLHGDHCFGLPGLLASVSLQRGQRADGSALRLVGPVGLRAMLEAVLTLSRTYVAFAVEYTEIPDGTERLDLGDVCGLHVVACAVRHVVPCYGYVLAEPQRPGPLDARRATELGARGAQLGQLKAGREVVVDGGAVVRPEQCVGAPRPGRKLAFAADNCELGAAMAEESRGCDLLVHECTLGDSKGEEAAAKFGHSTARMAGRAARSVGAARLVLTHFSARHGDGGEEDGEDGKRAETVQELVQQARETFGSDNIVAAEDFARITF
eukprot:m51a1_g13819 putative ribonuclease z (311) ;mRNA; f:423781-424775